MRVTDRPVERGTVPGTEPVSLVRDHRSVSTMPRRGVHIRGIGTVDFSDSSVGRSDARHARGISGRQRLHGGHHGVEDRAKKSSLHARATQVVPAEDGLRQTTGDLIRTREGSGNPANGERTDSPQSIWHVGVPYWRHAALAGRPPEGDSRELSGSALPLSDMMIPPRPPRDRGEGTGHPDEDPLFGPRTNLAVFVAGERRDSPLVRGIEEKLLIREVGVLSSEAIDHAQDQRIAQQHRDAFQRLQAVERSNRRHINGDEAEMQYRKGRELGVVVVDDYIDHLSMIEDDNARELAAARAAQHDLQRLREISVEGGDDMRPLGEFGVSKKEDNRILVHMAEALVRAHAGDVRRLPADQRELLTMQQLYFGEHAGAGTRDYGELTFENALDGSATVTIGFAVELPSGQEVPETMRIPEAGEFSALQLHHIHVQTADRQQFMYTLRKEVRGDEVRYRVAPMEAGGRTYGFPRGEGLLAKLAPGQTVQRYALRAILQGLPVLTDDIGDSAAAIEDFKGRYFPAKIALMKIVDREHLDDATLQTIIQWADVYRAANVLHQQRDLEGRSPQEYQDAEQAVFSATVALQSDESDPIRARAHQLYLTAMDNYTRAAGGMPGRVIPTSRWTGEYTAELDALNTEAAVRASGVLQTHIRQILAYRHRETPGGAH